ncbi:hypothetical protein [Pandoraea norimbergensis]|uniref:hypothetical protein n=1 Tax=Pandoraea norimbergensis TaxID=93219 RepID=UPI001C54F00D|nr:hypothetical protein [Pandoraea norimbergensis]
MNTPKLIHIFRPGRHVTMAGDVIEFSEADVAATARAYNPDLHEAPLVSGIRLLTIQPMAGCSRSWLLIAACSPRHAM